MGIPSPAVAGRLAVWLVGAAAIAQPAGASQILWSTGEPKFVTLDHFPEFALPKLVSFDSGFVNAATPQRLAAIPFRLTSDANVTHITALYNDVTDNLTRTNPQDVSYIVWERNGLAAPTTVAAEGSFGPYVAGAQYSNSAVAFPNDYLHEHSVNFALAAGDYYLSLYSKDKLIFWLSGGAQPDDALEQAFMWQSSKLPSPGFGQYVYPRTTELLEDGKDVYNPIFSIVGDAVPEPRAIVITATAAVCVVGGRVRVRR